MMSVECQNIAEQVESRRDIYLLLVSEDCPFCKQVLENFDNLDLKFDTLIVNVDECGESIEDVVSWPAVPMIAHFRNGEEIRRAVGVDGIMGFGNEPDTTLGVAADTEEADESEAA